MYIYHTYKNSCINLVNLKLILIKFERYPNGISILKIIIYMYSLLLIYKTFILFLFSIIFLYEKFSPLTL